MFKMLLIAPINKTNCELYFSAWDSGTRSIDCMSLRSIRCPQDVESDLTERQRGKLCSQAILRRLPF